MTAKVMFHVGFKISVMVNGEDQKLSTVSGSNLGHRLFLEALWTVVLIRLHGGWVRSLAGLIAD